MQSDQFRLTFDAELVHWWFVARRRILRDLIAEVVPPSPEAVIVDVGCATGGNVFRLADEYDCVGIEPSGEALRLARSRPSRARFVHGEAPDDLGPWTDRAKLFLVADVLEHVPDDAGLLRRLVERAADQAYFLLTVPADRSQWSMHDESHGHLRRYDRQGFEALWSGLPVETLLVSHFNARLYPMVKLVRAVNRWRGGSCGASGTDLSIPPRPVNRILERVLSGEARVLCDLLHGRCTEGYRRGVSLVALLQKTASAAGPAATARPAAHVAPVDRPLATLRRPANWAGPILPAPEPPSDHGPHAMLQTVIVVPCYNEAERLDLEAFRRHAAEGHPHRFLFVNDGSTDATLGVLRSFCREDPARFAVEDLPHNSGKAEAVRRGVLRAIDEGAELVGFWDADLATPLEVIPEFRRLFDADPGVQIVLGSRVRLLGRNIARRAARHYLGRGFATVASLVLGLPVYDTQCGAKLFRASDEVRRLFAEPFRSRWIFDVELLARLIRHRKAAGATPIERGICELPLPEWREVGGSKLKPRDFLRALFDLASIHWDCLRGGAIARARAALAAERAAQPAPPRRRAA